MNTDKITVLVTGTGGGGHGEQVVKALRLGHHDYHIVGTDITPRSSGRSIVDEFHVIPRATEPGFLDSVFDLAKQTKACAVFHGSEAEMMVFSTNKAAFAERNLYLPVNDLRLMDICQNKVLTFEFLAKHGITIPRFKKVSSVEDTLNVNFFPAVLKPSAGGGGSIGTFIVQDAGELDVFSRYLLPNFPQLILQEYVGTKEGEFTVGVTFGADGTLINSIAVKRVINNRLTMHMSVKNRLDRPDLGENLILSSGVSQGMVGRWEEVTAQAEKIAAAFSPTAPVNVQGRLVDGVFIPFEINPRYSGTTSLRAECGYNEPDILIRRDVLGETIENRFSYEEKTIYRVLSERIID